MGTELFIWHLWVVGSIVSLSVIAGAAISSYHIIRKNHLTEVRNETTAAFDPDLYAGKVMPGRE